ncbi:MFS transporter [Noviherbaspirillum suwonense]|uniref:D-galactonate transporter n=1 Tax=Noviherbaspirillum suwonense TaxID=1224511 RepID=A0ABY1Q633_9BURK|nr:MFS transporter [Noviherbaspirillum suwonense]SMP60945.1 D-galactonate transporter [Noviherbaspirillum suwonense]
MSDITAEGVRFNDTANIDRIYKKITWRLIPFLLFCYILSYLDRVNIGFAKLQMLSDLQFSEAVYGLGAGVFFLGYFFFEVPSNIIMHKVGARRWIARIMISWGILSAAMMFVNSATSFYVLRFLLGLAEAGFFPGIIYYLTRWYPADRRGRATSLFLTAIALAGVIGGPVSGWILRDTNGLAGLAGWQWMFLIEGIPSVLAGFFLLRFLDDKVEDAKWLTEAERREVVALLQKEEVTKSHSTIGKAFSSGRTWLLSIIYFLFVFSLYGISFWLPTIIKAAGVKDALNIGLLSALPWAAGVIAMVLMARSADRCGERRWHIAIPSVLGAIGFLIAVKFNANVPIAMLGMSIATMGIMSALPIFWSIPTAYLGGAAAAAGIALINSFGNLSGFVGPSLMGWIKEVTGSLDNGVYMLAGCLLMGGLLTLFTSSKLR